jgi:Spy/CpxP family protein refolding chaperone
MGCHALVFGLLGGFIAARLFFRFRYGGFHRYAYARCGTGGCSPGGGRGGPSGGWRRSGGWTGGGFGPRRIYRLFQELDLSQGQREAFDEIFAELKESLGGLRDEGRGGMDAVVAALTREEFDRAAVDAAAERQGHALGKLREQLVHALERAHAILIPEQREKLRQLLRLAGDPTPDGGPYRTSL